MNYPDFHIIIVCVPPAITLSWTQVGDYSGKYVTLAGVCHGVQESGHDRSISVQVSGKVNVSRDKSVGVPHLARGRMSSWLRVLCGRPAHAEASMRAMAINFWAWSSCLKV